MNLVTVTNDFATRKFLHYPPDEGFAQQKKRGKPNKEQFAWREIVHYTSDDGFAWWKKGKTPAKSCFAWRKKCRKPNREALRMAEKRHPPRQRTVWHGGKSSVIYPMMISHDSFSLTDITATL